MLLSPIQQIDKVLKILDTNSSVQKTIAAIALLAEDEVSQEKIILILNKLIKDGYSSKTQFNEFGSPYTDVYYQITFEGSLFTQQGGYQYHIENKASLAERVEAARNFQLEQTQTLNKLTRWIMISSCIAAIYYLYILFQAICNCQFVWQGN